VVAEADGDFKLEFVAGEHRDGPQNAFDGPGVLISLQLCVFLVFCIMTGL